MNCVGVLGRLVLARRSQEPTSHDSIVTLLSYLHIVEITNSYLVPNLNLKGVYFVLYIFPNPLSIFSIDYKYSIAIYKSMLRTKWWSLKKCSFELRIKDEEEMFLNNEDEELSLPLWRSCLWGGVYDPRCRSGFIWQSAVTHHLPPEHEKHNISFLHFSVVLFCI